MYRTVQAGLEDVNWSMDQIIQQLDSVHRKLKWLKETTEYLTATNKTHLYSNCFDDDCDESGW